VIRLGSVKSTVENLHVKLRHTLDAKMTAAERSARLIELLEQEERSAVAMHLELKRLRDTHYNRTGDLERLKSEHRSIETEIQVRECDVVECFWIWLNEFGCG